MPKSVKVRLGIEDGMRSVSEERVSAIRSKEQMTTEVLFDPWKMLVRKPFLCHAQNEVFVRRGILVDGQGIRCPIKRFGIGPGNSVYPAQ